MIKIFKNAVFPVESWIPPGEDTLRMASAKPHHVECRSGFTTAELGSSFASYRCDLMGMFLACTSVCGFGGKEVLLPGLDTVVLWDSINLQLCSILSSFE